MLLVLVLESFKIFLLLLMALPGSINTFFAQLLAFPAMIFYAGAAKVLNTETFPQHNITDLISRITFIALFSQEKPLQ